MNTLLVFTVLFAGACMADVSHIVPKEPAVRIISQSQDATPDGGYIYSYKTENGISADAQGAPDGTVQGVYSYPAPDGTPIQVTWSAGPKGFIADGPSVPKTPESVLRTLAYNEAHPYKEPIQP